MCIRDRVTRPAQVADFPVLLRIYKQWAAIQKSEGEPQLDALAENLVRWLDARQCFVMEQDGQPVTWFVLEFPQADDYNQHNSTTKPTATMVGPYTVIRQRNAISRMYSFCQRCCPNLQIWVEADDATALACWKGHLMAKKKTAEDKAGRRLDVYKRQGPYFAERQTSNIRGRHLQHFSVTGQCAGFVSLGCPVQPMLRIGFKLGVFAFVDAGTESLFQSLNLCICLLYTSRCV